ncbi:polyprenyl synthetase family protein [Leptospira ognonensis]|uniref:Polyprenyl synthetase family protein n=1 Tax=Leptospira ognonensis TaxID=2484945 RepID=A0A4R9JZJ4_9LEPT|nr:polyprenyl synthetase family protein [Leptospira ognonensis]TGL57159.1 polyprenyl synthetase family protein [Leptospira ognonensis]
MPSQVSLAKLLRSFDQNLNKIIGDDLPILKLIKRFVIESGGKRIRPITHYLFCHFVGYSGKKWQEVGAVAELIHSASLLHDDVVDNASLRRGKPTVGASFGNKTAILSGDFLLACGIERLNSLELPAVMHIFSRVLRDLAVSELIQMEWEKNPKISMKIYESIIYGKTASLFGACTESAGHLAGLSGKECKELSDFGIRLGKLFQKKDDCLDYFYTSKESGKEFLKDFKNGLYTYPILILKDTVSSKTRKEIDLLFLKTERTERDCEQILSLLKIHNIEQRLTDEFNKENIYFQKFLSKFPDTAERRLFQDQIQKLI